MYCITCQYDLRESDGHCPECGRPFVSSDPQTYSLYPLPRWYVIYLKTLSIIDHWWFYFGYVCVFTVLVMLANSLWQQIVFSIMTLLGIWNLVRRIMRGPYFEQVLRESAE